MAVLRKRAKLPVRKKIINELGEYFFGTKTSNYYTYEKAFYKEFFKNPYIFKMHSKVSFKQKLKYLFFYKHTPTIIETTSLAFSFLDRESAWAVLGFFCGEIIRIGGIFENPVRKNRRFLENNIRTLDNSMSLEENALEMTQHWGSGMNIDWTDMEGEEWKYR